MYVVCAELYVLYKSLSSSRKASEQAQEVRVALSCSRDVTSLYSWTSVSFTQPSYKQKGCWHQMVTTTYTHVIVYDTQCCHMSHRLLDAFRIPYCVMCMRVLHKLTNIMYVSTWVSHVNSILRSMVGYILQ